MADFDFQGNARTLFDTLVQRPPFFVRPMVRRALTGALERRVGPGGRVDAAAVVAALHEATPKPMVDRALKSIAGLYRCATPCAGCTGSCPLAPPA